MAFREVQAEKNQPSWTITDLDGPTKPVGSVTFSKVYWHFNKAEVELGALETVLIHADRNSLPPPTSSDIR
jgi:hypothetical protein